MRAWFAWAETAPSGIRRAAQTAPPLPGPLPTISKIQASFGSPMENDSPPLRYPCVATRSAMTSMASRAVFARCSVTNISEP